ncbi:hypothetical protein FE783_10480 [Paenibacillus mesophilus]|uniref:hypothetical protein n=1 Tax=Paenibacillus mesophilus TaxID=2582849 RepID=UPI00110D9E4A|nr:hypothetical protein [Paenibacillus mesophilus]TMV49990.1 hypothetical protein FE783_10480 [Paenibacillus mesophilus]
MEHHIESAVDKSMLLPQPSDHSKEVQEVPHKPKLTMKYLYELIQELQQENRSLAFRLEVLESRLAEDHLSRERIAATAELPVADGEGGGTSSSIEATAASPQPANVDHAQLAGITEIVHVPNPPVNISPIQNSNVTGVTEPILIPRSERHPARKKTFWTFFLFRSRTT